MPDPLITLRLSHPNFLDAVLTVDGRPLYSFETIANQTNLFRCDTQTDGLEDVATITWPCKAASSSSLHRKKDKDAAVPRIRMRDGTVKGENEFLRNCTGVMTACRKFRLPGQHRSLRWRKVSNSGVYECTSPISSTPIAHFEPANYLIPAKLKVYVSGQSFRDTFSSNPQMTVDQVSTTLLDYLVVTTLLLVTPKGDWKSMPLAGAPLAPTVSSPLSISTAGMISSVSVGNSPISPTSPSTPFTNSPSPVSSNASSSGDSWYRSAPPAAPRESRSLSQRPKTSPSTTTTMTTSSRSSMTPSIRRSTSIYIRPPPSQPLQHWTMVDLIDSPVLDIRPSTPPSTTTMTPVSPLRLTRTHSPQLRLHVPQSPPASTQRTHYHPLPPTPRDEEPAFPFLKSDPNALMPAAPGDEPPPYEEIEWTVRVRGPRRSRSTIGA